MTYGILQDNDVLETGKIPTKSLNDPTQGLQSMFSKYTKDNFEAISYCSVVPNINKFFLSSAKRTNKPIFQLTYNTCNGIHINYQKPEQIGQDRLATIVGAQKLYGTPAIVIDMGTAVTFDIITEKNGYETSVIAPGLELMVEYLYEKTAQLPKLDPADLLVPSVIGQSTKQAMKAGCSIGFSGMVKALLDAILKELTTRGESQFKIIGTGGSAGWLLNNWFKNIKYDPNLSLKGLAESYHRFHNSPTIYYSNEK